MYKLALSSCPEYLLGEILDHQDPEICKYAVKSNWKALQHIKPEFITMELYLIALRQNPILLEEICYYEGYFKKNKYVDEIIELVVQNNGLDLKHIASSRMSLKICMLAIKNNPDALQYVPEEYKNKLNKKIEI